MMKRLLRKNYLQDLIKNVDILSFLKVEQITNELTDYIIQQIDQENIQISEVNARVSQYRDHIETTQIRKYGIAGLSRHKSQSVPHIQYFISEITEEDKIRARQMMQSQQIYHQRLEEKARKLQQKIRYEEEREKMERESKRIQMFKSKKHLFKEGIERIRERQEKRKRQISQENIRFQKVAKQRTLHEKLIQKWNKEAQLKQKQKQQAYKILRETKKVDFKEIKAHQSKYDEKKSEVKIKQSRASDASGYSDDELSFYKSVFLSRIVEEDENNKERIFQKQRLAKEFAQKRSQYAKIVRQNYRPKILQKSKFKLKNSEETLHRSMSHAQIVKKGNDYLKGSLQEVKKKNRTRPLFRPIEQKKFQYTNYLTEIREKFFSNKTQQKLKTPNQQSRGKYQQQIKKIMSRPNLTQEQKFFKAKLATKKMEERVVKKNPYALIDTINAKIEILKNVTN